MITQDQCQLPSQMSAVVSFIRLDALVRRQTAFLVFLRNECLVNPNDTNNCYTNVFTVETLLYFHMYLLEMILHLLGR